MAEVKTWHSLAFRIGSRDLWQLFKHNPDVRVTVEGSSDELRIVLTSTAPFTVGEAKSFQVNAWDPSPQIPLLDALGVTEPMTVDSTNKPQESIG